VTEKIQVNISQQEVDQLCLDYYDLPRDLLNMIREDIYELLELATEEPELSEDPDFMVDLTQAFTARQALIQLNKLHDA
jgi:hypothetical protein